ncbi:Domain of unknown function (DUF1935), putative [Angomonas deanei]|uniref:DUF1935 domain-containing protein n=1 Tax=Angomonas deanei TaxID=59799 RepID=A0A7G2C818_9TRYP|nr:Domain of unknown function (DUF1935), putative [Angomonas deanei]
MGCGASNVEDKPDKIVFKNGKPKFSYTTISPCFKDKGNGLLFLMKHTKKQTWAYYNDTTEYEMHVKVTFGQHSAIRALGKTSITQQDDDGSYVASVVVYPLETVLFIEGKDDGYSANVDALNLSDEYRAMQAEKEAGKKKKK